MSKEQPPKLEGWLKELDEYLQSYEGNKDDFCNGVFWFASREDNPIVKRALELYLEQEEEALRECDIQQHEEKKIDMNDNESLVNIVKERLMAKGIAFKEYSNGITYESKQGTMSIYRFPLWIKALQSFAYGCIKKTNERGFEEMNFITQEGSQAMYNILKREEK